LGEEDISIRSPTNSRSKSLYFIKIAVPYSTRDRQETRESCKYISSKAATISKKEYTG
jgi:hypothetical protein